MLVIAAGRERQAALFENMIVLPCTNQCSCVPTRCSNETGHPHCRARDGFVTAVLLPAWSQRADRPRRVGVLFSGLTLDPAMRPPVLQALVDGLREHGWEEGRNVALEVRYADLDPARLLELAAELT